jgi:hypothetical protein
LGMLKQESVQVISLTMDLSMQAPSSTSTHGTTTPKAPHSNCPT